MEAFATVEDLLSGWPGKTFTEAEEDSAETLLDRASAQLSSMLKQHGVAIDPEDEEQALNLLSVTCNMVRRSMSQGYDGVSSFAQTVGSTNVSVNYRENDGSFYVSKSEKELLGVSGRGGFRMLRAAIHNPDGSLVDGW